MYTSGSGTFANLRELEIYSPNGLVPMFDGLEPMDEIPEVITGENASTSEEVTSAMPSLEINKVSVKQSLGTVEESEISESYTFGKWEIVTAVSIAIVSVIGLGVYFVRRKTSK